MIHILFNLPIFMNYGIQDIESSFSLVSLGHQFYLDYLSKVPRERELSIIRNIPN